ncbi:hypothetical protein K469DRAFT_719677 [Zopfia rhizophila CBS 207.26]|uniref:CCHC-type domain-containing protein n=1 Tax=Zopfia rhizophila CBS 207.26 TaxID=1314779 RepID=A0A6A6D5A2_9PEZI|nr:hypothetical protein K469DRAFT_719677 [Zopfia rhizophila CBS 207.26]
MIAQSNRRALSAEFRRTSQPASQTSFLVPAKLQNQRTEIQSLQLLQSDPLTLRTWLPSIRAKLRSDQLAGADAFDYASVLHLCQEEESLIAYLTRFERLTDSLFSLLYNDYIELVQRLDRRSRRPQLAQKPTQKTAHEPMDVDHPIRIASARVSFPRRPVSPTSSQSSSPDRHTYRQLNGLCFCCGSPDHWIDSCPYPVLPRQPRTKTTARSPTLDALAARREDESNIVNLTRSLYP